LGYDALVRHFLPKQYGYEWDLPISLADLTPDDPRAICVKSLARMLFLFPLSFHAKVFPSGVSTRMRIPWMSAGIAEESVCQSMNSFAVICLPLLPYIT
jgi:hypothetical protein